MEHGVIIYSFNECQRQNLLDMHTDKQYHDTEKVLLT